MAKRDFLDLVGITEPDARNVLALARVLKDGAKDAQLGALAGCAIAVIFEKHSTRTRVSFEAGIAQLGAHPVILDAQSSQLGRGEPIKDTARVLSRYCDAIVYRTFGQERLEEMARHASVPVVNALSDQGHPVQVLCDVFTIEEALGRPIQGEKVAWVGDGASNMARSFVEAACLFDFELVVAAPDAYGPSAEDRARGGKHVRVVRDPREAVREASVINTDVWTSMGQEAERAERLRALEGFAVDDALLAHARRDVVVLHCLPAHRGEEISDAVIEGPRSRVWDQAENRLHVQKALLLWLLGKG
jgi:ornithine carbamoyltransferase